MYAVKTGDVLAEEALELLSTEGVLTVLCITLRAAHMSIACRLDALVSSLTRAAFALVDNAHCGL
jgi:hypothetical protein